jgi:hypothetical protein
MSSESADDVIECPRCECNDSKLLHTGTRWGKPIERRRCAHCGFTWNLTIVAKQSAPIDEAAAAERRRRFLEHKGLRSSE